MAAQLRDAAFLRTQFRLQFGDLVSSLLILTSLVVQSVRLEPLTARHRTRSHRAARKKTGRVSRKGTAVLLPTNTNNFATAMTEKFSKLFRCDNSSLNL